MDRRAFLTRLSASALALPWAGVAGLAGCGRYGSLTVGMHPWIGYETLLLARSFGWLPENLRLVESDNSTATQAGLKAGSLDAGCLTLDEVLRLRAEGVPLAVIAVMDVSSGADVVLAKPEIRGLADLAGKRIAYESGAVGSLMLHGLMLAAGLADRDVTLVPLPPEQHLAAWRAGRIDVAVTYWPRCDDLEKAGAIRLFDSRRLPATIIDVLAVRSDHTSFKGATLKALLAGHFRAVDHLKHSREDAERRIAFWRKVSVDEVKHGLAGVEVPGEARNREMLAPNGPLMQSARHLAALMLDHGHLSKAADLEALVDARFLPGLPR